MVDDWLGDKTNRHYIGNVTICHNPSTVIPAVIPNRYEVASYRVLNGGKSNSKPCSQMLHGAGTFTYTYFTQKWPNCR